MPILTDGPKLEPVDKWTATYLQQLEAARQHEIMLMIVFGLAVLVLIVVAGIVLPRVWLWARRGLAGPVRMADPKA
jgi:hypothetical protein